MSLFTEEEIKKINENQPKTMLDQVQSMDPGTYGDTQTKEEPKNQIMVPIDNDGIMGFANQLELSTAAKFAIQVKLAPEHLRKEGLEAVASVMMFCRQHRLPLSAMNQIFFLKGRIECYGSLVTALAQRHENYGEMQIFFLDENQNRICMENKNLKETVWACVVRTLRKGDTEWNEFFYTWDEATAAGLVNNPSQTYKKFRKDMLWHRAKSRALDFNYASALEGVYYHEANIIQAPEQIKEVGPSLSEKLGLQKTPTADLES